MGQFLNLLDDFRLTTAEILYHLPDHPQILQTYIWQDYDHIPDYPKLQNFLIFWQSTIEGPLHSVRVAYADSMHIQRVRVVDWSETV